jgi:hypothetical protein
VPIRRIQQPGWYRGETVVGTRAEEILEAGSSTDNALAAVTNSTNHRPKTRLQSGIRNPKVYNNGTIRYGCFTSTVSLNN